MKDARKEKEPAKNEESERRGSRMNPYVGIIISLAVFGIGTWLFKKQRFLLIYAIIRCDDFRRCRFKSNRN